MNSKPNILFLLSDEHSFRFGSFADEKDREPVETPALGRLAEKGTVFSNAYCQMPLCSPSRISMLTGLESRHCGAWWNSSVLRPELPTLPATFRDSGYSTALIGKMHLGGTQQFIGFQNRPYGDLLGSLGHQPEPLDRNSINEIRSRTSHTGTTEIPESLIQDQIVSQETVSYLREQKNSSPEQPWFLCASFSRPHFPLTAPSRWVDRYWPEGVTQPKVPAAGDAYNHPMSKAMRKGFKSSAIDKEEMMKARASYFSCVSYLDEIIGDLLLRLDSSGQLDNTIIVYASDHGEMAGEHGVWWKNGWYEGCTRVPLIISTPEQRRGEQPSNKMSTPVGLYDIFPTLCDLAGVEAPSDLNGRSLASSVREGESAKIQPVVCDNFMPRWGEGSQFRSIRLGDYKYVRFKDAQPLFFNLRNDPEEQRNLLVHELSPEAQDVLDSLKESSELNIDFDDIEKTRLERDGSLREDFAIGFDRKGHVHLNQYHFPSGRIIAADDPVYSPTVISESAEALFGKDWNRQNSSDNT